MCHLCHYDKIVHMELKTALTLIKRAVQFPIAHILEYLRVENIYVQTFLLTFVNLFVIWWLHRGFLSLKTTFSNRLAKNESVFLLHKAITENNTVTCIRIIKKYPEAINTPAPPENYTPFLRACLHGNTQIVKLMIKYGADLNLTTAKNETCFYLAVYNMVQCPSKTDASCLHALFYAGVDINASNDRGYCPLQLASIFGHTPLVRWLLMKGANKNCTPSPYVLARLEGHEHTAAVLRSSHHPCIL